jgi:hypothetical protein
LPDNDAEDWSSDTSSVDNRRYMRPRSTVNGFTYDDY